MEFNLKELIKGFLVICSYFVLQVILATPFIFFIEKKIISYNTSLLFIYIGLTIIYLLAYRKNIIEDLKDFKKNYKHILKRTIKYWLIGLIIMILSTYVINLFNVPVNDNQESNISFFKEAPLIQATCSIILAPIIEELVFRRSFKNFTNNPILFGLVTGLLFGFVHIISSLTGPQDLIMFAHLIPYSAVGIAFGYVYKEHNNIIGTMLIHSLHNLIAIIEIIILL